MRLGGVAIVTLLLPACATVTRGTQQSYLIESVPPEADVALSTGVKCKTPCRLKLKRKQEFTATFTKEGYETAQAKVESKISTGGGVAAAGNVLMGGVIGGVIDGTNGSMNDLTPNPLVVRLKPVGQAADAAPAEQTGAAPAAAAPAPAPGGEG